MAEQDNIQKTTRNQGKKRDRIGLILYFVYLLLLVISVVVVVKLIYFQVSWKPDPKIESALTPKSTRKKLEPIRGNILDFQGRLLAISYPLYDIHMDCTVRKREFESVKNPESGRKKEAEWLGKAQLLCQGLQEIVPEIQADKMYEKIRSGRENRKKFLKIAEGVDRSTMLRIKALPLFEEGQNKGGIIVDQRNIRKYPYGKLARRAIGFVRDNSDLAESKGSPGIEGHFNEILHGSNGVEYLRHTDYGKVRDFDSTYVVANDGKDIRTTLNIDYQRVADNALRSSIDTLTDLSGGCLVLMDVKTGAIRAMVNLARDRDGSLGEITNHVVGRRWEPGSVFKTVMLLSVLKDGYCKSLEETMPTNHGVINNSTIESDQHIRDWERVHGTDRISIMDGFAISSNYVFATLSIKNYGRNPRKFIDNVHDFGLGDNFDFDLDGLLRPILPDTTKKIGNNTLGNLGFGYALEVTPLHVITFYNALANKGRMMKPYLVEQIEKDGGIVEHRGPSILNEAICSRAIADTMTRALLSVTEDGTAKVLKNAKCKVAGKTGTSYGTFAGGGYAGPNGTRKYQATFAGYFPADNPQYSILCSVFSKPTRVKYQGGGIPATVVKTVVDYICDNDSHFRPVLTARASVPEMESGFAAPVADDSETSIVPDLKGLGLKDALFICESLGFECRYTGVGHTVSQSPKAGTTADKGTCITIELK